jgi:hypothetical protein
VITLLVRYEFNTMATASCATSSGRPSRQTELTDRDLLRRSFPIEVGRDEAGSVHQHRGDGDGGDAVRSGPPGQVVGEPVQSIRVATVRTTRWKLG